MKFLNLFLTAFALSTLLACNNNDDDEPNIPVDNTPEGYTLVFSDEFDQAVINPAKWVHETGDGTAYGLPAGWGNNELQIYTSGGENSYIATDDGVSGLSITALSDGSGGYTSARLTTQNLFSMRFGRIDVRARMPQGQGLWAAIWMLGDNKDVIGWPGCGEIDIVEVLGNETETRYSTLHFTNGEKKHEEIQNTHQLQGNSFSDGYHVFGLEWTPETLTFTLDENPMQEVPIEDDMKEFLRSFYLVMNVAVGGNWPGYPDNTTVFPQTMHVDYIRVYEKKGFNAPNAPQLNIDEETVGQVIEPNIADNAIREGFTELGSLTVVAYGGGGEPEIATSENAVDGDLSLVFDFPGGNWGGAYIEMAEPRDISGYTYIRFSLNTPVTLADAEIKLESPASNAAIFLKDYTGTAVSGGFLEYTIPLSDFSGLDLTELTIPFSVWNPQNASQGYVTAMVLIDNLYFSN